MTSLKTKQTNQQIHRRLYCILMFIAFQILVTSYNITRKFHSHHSYNAEAYPTTYQYKHVCYNGRFPGDPGLAAVALFLHLFQNRTFGDNWQGIITGQMHSCDPVQQCRNTPSTDQAMTITLASLSQSTIKLLGERGNANSLMPVPKTYSNN